MKNILLCHVDEKRTLWSSYNVCFIPDVGCLELGMAIDNLTVEYRKKCYQFVNDSKSREESKHHCEDRNGRLAEILDASTFDFLSDTAIALNKTLGGFRSWWIGGYCDKSLNTRSWFWLESELIHQYHNNQFMVLEKEKIKNLIFLKAIWSNMKYCSVFSYGNGPIFKITKTLHFVDMYNWEFLLLIMFCFELKHRLAKLKESRQWLDLL